MKKERKSPAIARFIVLDYSMVKLHGIGFAFTNGERYPVEVTIRKVLKRRTK